MRSYGSVKFLVNEKLETWIRSPPKLWSLFDGHGTAESHHISCTSLLKYYEVGRSTKDGDDLARGR